jgi:hypothetical protein
LTGLASAVVASAAAQDQKAQEPKAQERKAQDQKADADLDLGPDKGTEELWYLLTALDALIFDLAIAVIKDQAVIVQARREIRPYTQSRRSRLVRDSAHQRGRVRACHSHGSVPIHEKGHYPVPTLGAQERASQNPAHARPRLLFGAR